MVPEPIQKNPTVAKAAKMAMPPKAGMASLCCLRPSGRSSRFLDFAAEIT
ncbi:MAG: hypothetical protein IPQ03_10495 [Bacteroidetes bacterium]|nr:hypothetical protein [Bacteroidota bacterium]MBL0257908.1 hypothetical protein [Bacteroidota bacterium]